MQSSPYHANRLYDGKLNFLNVPKSSKTCAWKLVKEIDEKTGSFTYKLVNNETENKLIHTKLNLIQNEDNEKKSILSQKGKINYPVVDEGEKVSTGKLVKENEIFSEYLLENNSKVQIDFSTFRAKYRNYVFSCFNENIIKVNSKDISKLSEYSRILDYRKGYLTKIDQVIISLQGDCDNNFDNLYTLLSFKFLKKNEKENNIYYYNTNKLEVKNNEGKLFQQFVGNVQSFLPSSDSNIFNYIPNIQIFNENNSLSSIDLIVKIILKIQKVPIDSINETEIRYLPLEN